MGALETLSSLGRLVREVREAEVKSGLLDQVLLLQAQVGQLQEENLELKAKLREQEQQLKAKQDMATIRKSLYFRGNAYWGEGKGPPEQPYCIGCFEDKEKLVPLLVLGDGYWQCPVCKQVITG
ncbi:MAG: hypothetical protein AMXMBFR13_14290 [Phycisphaerae bacterium]